MFEPASEIIIKFFGNYDQIIVSAILTIIISLIGWYIKKPPKIIWGLVYQHVHSVTLSSMINLLSMDKIKQHTSLEIKIPDDEMELQKINNTNLLVYTVHYSIQNIGSNLGTGVEITLNFEPDSLEVWPQRQFNIEINPNQRMVVKFDTMFPDESLTLAMIGLDREPPIINSIRFDQAASKFVQFNSQRVYSGTFLVLVAILLFLGLFSLIYLFVLLISALI